jgi:hypothetical protein
MGNTKIREDFWQWPCQLLESAVNAVFAGFVDEADGGRSNMVSSERISHSVKLTGSLDRTYDSNDRYSSTIFLNRKASSNISLLLKKTYERP